MRRLSFFFKLFAIFNLRHLMRHRWRALAVICGIALGAAVFTSVRLAVHASLDAFTRSMDLIAGRSDAIVTNPGGRVPELLVAQLFSIEGVKAVSPMMTAYITPAASEEPFLLIGIDPILDRNIRDWSIAASTTDTGSAWLNLMRLPGTLMLGRPLAERFKVSAGDRLRLAHANNIMSFKITGVLAAEGLALAEGGRVAITDIATFQEFTHIYSQVDRIDLVYKPEATPEQKTAVKLLIAGKASLSGPSETRDSGRRLIKTYQLNLSVLGFASLFVGMFLVYSLIALNATARRRELAILSAIGATRFTIFNLFITEGLALGVLGWVIAIPVSSLVMSFMIAGISNTISTLFVRVAVTGLSLSPFEIAISLGVTLFISAAAAYIPARQAMQVMPREALSQSPTAPKSARLAARPLFIAGAACLAAIPVLSKLPGMHGLPLPGYLATVLLFAGFSLFAPFVLQALSTRLRNPVLQFFGAPGRLALGYIRHSGTRTAVSVGALITAVALFTALVIMIHSFRKTVEIWVSQTVSGDIFITPRNAEINGHKNPLSAQIIDHLKKIGPGATVVPFRRISLSRGDVRFQLEAMDLAAFKEHGSFLWVAGSPDTAYTRAMNGRGVLISEVFHSQTGIGVGDIFETRLRQTPIRLPVVGIIRDYRTNGGVVFCSLEAAAPALTDTQADQDSIWSGARIFLKAPGINHQQTRSDLAAARLRDSILAAADTPLTVIIGRDLRKQILKIFDETFAVTFLLLLIALAVATLGIATTMTILVLERAVQLNTLTAVGADNNQIRKMIFTESAFLVVVGEVLGLGCGFILSYLLVYVINAQSFGWTFLYRVDWPEIFLSLPLIFSAAMVSALPAIRLVFRMPPADLLREQTHG